MIVGDNSQGGSAPEGGAALPDPVNLEAVADRLSRARLSKYLTRALGDVGGALDLYVWNQELGEALSTTLSQFEVCLRNSVAAALSDKFGGNWHTLAKVRHLSPELSSEFEKAHQKFEGQARNPELPDFIAASNFNLWREFCKPAYAGHFWSKRTRLAFPHCPLRRSDRDILQEVHRRVDLLLKLRNRIAHHEPLIGSNWERIGEKVRARHREMTELLEWMDPNFARWLLGRDRFATVMEACPVPHPTPQIPPALSR